MLVNAAVYGKPGQKNPAVMDGYEVCGNRILIHFSVPGQAHLPDETCPLRIGEEILPAGSRQKKPIGLYICGASGTYVPADCEIPAPDTIALSHPGIANPVHAAYGYNSMETGCNLWAGEYPAAFFRTDAKKWNPAAEDGLITIECKPWCDPARVRVWTDDGRQGYLDVFYRPVWKPCTGSEVVHDNAFTLENGSIRLEGRPWGLQILFASYNNEGKLLDLQLVEVTSDLVAVPTDGTYTAFFLNNRCAPAHETLPISE